MCGETRFTTSPMHPCFTRKHPVQVLPKQRATGGLLLHPFCVALTLTWHHRYHSCLKLYRHRPQIALKEQFESMARAGDKLGRHPTQRREKDGKGKQDLNHPRQRQARKMTRRQRQPRAKSGTETSLGTTAAAAAKSEIMKGDKLGRPGGSGSQERSYEGRQA